MTVDLVLSAHVSLDPSRLAAFLPIVWRQTSFPDVQKSVLLSAAKTSPRCRHQHRPPEATSIADSKIGSAEANS
jgi:hypothetical protein